MKRLLVSFLLGTCFGVWVSYRWFGGRAGPVVSDVVTPSESPLAPRQASLQSSAPPVRAPARQAPTRRVDPPDSPPPTTAKDERNNRQCPFNALDYRVTHPGDSSFLCQCSGAAAEEGTLWGSGPYTGDSSICRAAKHAGYWRADGDEVRVYFRDGQAAYEGTEAYGVQSQPYGAFESSISFN